MSSTADGTTDKGKQEAPHNLRSVTERITRETSDELTGDMKMLYDQVSSVIRQSITGGFTPDKITVLIAIIIRTVQEFSDNKDTKIPGPEKQAMALKIVKYVLADFNKNGQIPNDVYEQVMVGVDILGPSLITLVVSAWKKGAATAQDIGQHGCKGCTKRNCCVQ